MWTHFWSSVSSYKTFALKFLENLSRFFSENFPEISSFTTSVQFQVFFLTYFQSLAFHYYDKHYARTNLGKEVFIWLTVPGHSLLREARSGNQGRVGTWSRDGSKDRGESLLLGLLSSFAQLAFLYSLGPSTQEWPWPRCTRSFHSQH